MKNKLDDFIEIDEKSMNTLLEIWSERIDKIENTVYEIETWEKTLVNTEKILSLLHFLLEVLYSAVEWNPEAIQWLIIENRTKIRL